MRNTKKTTVFECKSESSQRGVKQGFALVVTLVLMVLLTLIAIGLLSLSTIALRSSATDREMTIARANARLALMVALGNLQESMGPDTRVSASASILDSSATTPTIDGVANPHLLGVWESWGGWLNAEAKDPDGKMISIDKTYPVGRPEMFRKWLVSAEPAETEKFDFAKTGTFDAANSVVLVGEKSVTDTKDYVRARLMPIQEGAKLTGRMAWWVGGENQKADIRQNSPSPNLSVAATELAHGSGTARDMSEITGFSGVTRDTTTTNKLVTMAGLENAGADTDALAEGFHDFTAHGIGLLTDTRWGGLKKDLSLLLDKPALPSEYTRSSSTAYSPRPLSKDLLDLGPRLSERGFTSFEQIHAFARQYKDSSNWTGTAPNARTAAFGNNLNADEPQGYYRRMPVISKFFSVYNLQAVKTGTNGNREDIFDCYLTYSPIVQMWNPYNVPLTIDKKLEIHTLPYKVMPIRFKTFKNGQPYKDPRFGTGGREWVGVDQNGISSLGGDYESPFQTASGGTQVKIGPGEFKLFSFKTRHSGGLNQNQEPLRAGFDPGGVGSARLLVMSGVTKRDSPEIAVQVQPYWIGANAWWWGANPGALSIIANYHQNSSSSQNRASTSLNIDWFASPTKPDPNVLPAEQSRQDYASITPEERRNRARWVISSNDSEPVPIAVVGMVLKTSEEMTYDTIGWEKDWRNKTWAQAAPGHNAEQMLASYTDSNLLELQRMNGAYQLLMRTITGSAELSELIGHNPAKSEYGYLGTTLETPISAAAAYEVPTAPVQSLAGFSGLRLQPGWYNWKNRQIMAREQASAEWASKIAAYKSGVPGLGVGNSFAVPMIPGNKVYQYHDISRNRPESQIDSSGTGQNSNAFSDFWDHQLLVNDGLWDSFYTSSMTNSQRPTDSGAESLSDLLDKFFKNGQSLPNANYQPLSRVAPDQAIADLQAADGYLRSAMYLANRGAFNVNSTSVDAWYSLFTGLREHKSVYRDSNGRLKEIEIPDGKALVTRFNTETAEVETPDQRTGVQVDGISTWTGVRFLDDDQLRVLAEKCVEQVKLRGPFLNMSDFVNRRLSTGDLGTRGALQAAIDYDDESPDSNSINRKFKGSRDMVASDTSLYPFPKAAEGSMFTGIPGYVVQSDILKPLGNSLTVRDDSFRIRAYGEATDATGKVLARAHCEAIVQRTIDYVDPANNPVVPSVPLDQNGNVTGNTALTAANQRFGRRFKIVSFRWLSPNEI